MLRPMWRWLAVRGEDSVSPQRWPRDYFRFNVLPVAFLAGPFPPRSERVAALAAVSLRRLIRVSRKLVSGMPPLLPAADHIMAYIS